MSTENYLENYLYTKAAQNRVPISGTFELLPVCNLNCKMCYVKKSMSEVKQLGGLREADEWISLGKRAVNAGMLFLLLTGGEPFLYPEFERLYKELHKLGLAIDINSNGTLIGQEEISWLKSSMPRHVKISLYGASEKSYNALCGDGSAFKKVIRNIESMKNAGITVYSSITVTPSNIAELDEMLKLCDDFEVPVKATSYMFPPWRSMKINPDKDYRLTSEKAAEVSFKIAKLQNDADVFQNKIKEYSADKFQNYMENISIQNQCGKMECRGGKCTFWITWDGKMTPCAMMDYGKYSVMDNYNFEEAWEKTQRITETIETPTECVNCSVKQMCYSCAGASFCETGYTHKRSSYICQMTNCYLKIMKQEYLNSRRNDE